MQPIQKFLQMPFSVVVAVCDRHGFRAFYVPSALCRDAATGVFAEISVGVVFWFVKGVKTVTKLFFGLDSLCPTGWGKVGA